MKSIPLSEFQKTPERLVSVKEIILKVYRDFNFKDDNNNRWADMIEWAGEALEFLHVSTTLIEKQVELEVDSYRAVVPCDFYKEIQIDTKIESTGSFDYNRKFPNTPNSFKIEYPYIKVPLERGTINLSYYAFPVDQENFPLIPDSFYVKECLMWYIIYKMLLGGMKSDVVDFQYARETYKEYARKARATYRMPDLSALETIKNQWLRLVPRISSFDNNFANQSTPETQPITDRNYHERR